MKDVERNKSDERDCVKKFYFNSNYLNPEFSAAEVRFHDESTIFVAPPEYSWITLIFRQSGNSQLITVRAFIDEQVSDIIERYRKISGDNDQIIGG